MTHHHVRSFSARHAAALAVALASLTLTACGGSDATTTDAASSTAATGATTTATTTPTATSYPLTIDNCGQKIVFKSPPKRVVILNGSSVGEVENFITLGLQKDIVANSQSYGVSDDATMTEKIAAVPRAGIKLNENFEVPREQVLALKPDLVVSTWSGGFDPKIGSISREELAKAGIASYVTPSNCSNGDPTPRPQDTAAYDDQNVESSFSNLFDLARIFDVQQQAADYIAAQRKVLATVKPSATGKRPSVLLAVPGMSGMTQNGVPAIFGGKGYDDIVTRAGGVNAFPDLTDKQSAALNVEALASAKVDVLIIGLFTAKDDAKVLAEELFKKFPQWQASKTKTYAAVADGLYPGPLNALAVKKIADAVGRVR